MRRIFSGDRGFAGVMLVLVIVWALLAVLLLTGTLLAATRIDDSVAIINPEVADINEDTKLVALAAKTAKVTTQIRKAAEPLTGELAQTLEAARGIDREAKSINEGLTELLPTVREINGNVLPINATVGRINANTNSINASVQSINGNARSISASAGSIRSDTAMINASVRSIRSNGGTILSEVVSIDGRVRGINERAIIARGVVSDLGADLVQVLRLVGRSSGDRPGNTIAGNANSIDCSTVFRVVGGTDACNR